MNQFKAGLMPLYAGLYDSRDPRKKDTFKPFIDEIVQKLMCNDIELVRSPVCVYENNIEDAIHSFEEQETSAVIILFLAYHPSLVSVGTLTQTNLPIIMLDTTQCYNFDSHTDPVMVSRCHGIHGVQDLCCVLRRMGKNYLVEAGHYENSDVIARVADCVKACSIAECFRKSRVGIIGEPFENMGDFALPFGVIEKLTGVKTIPLTQEKASLLSSSIDEDELHEQMNQERGLFETGEGVDNDLIGKSSVSMLAISKWIEQEKLDAFTFNFLDFNKDLGLPAIPFAAACQLMAKGVGYGGEGDVLTAALTAALMKVYPDSTFCEMFCPDWKGNTIFLSHMGEANYSVLHKPALVRKKVDFVPNLNGGVMIGVTGVYKSGKAVLVNLAPGADSKFSLILARCELIEPADGDNFVNSIRGWMKPELPIEEFLRSYSMLGGTHHSCICYDADFGILKTFGEIMGWKVFEL